MTSERSLLKGTGPLKQKFRVLGSISEWHAHNFLSQTYHQLETLAGS